MTGGTGYIGKCILQALGRAHPSVTRHPLGPVRTEPRGPKANKQHASPAKRTSITAGSRIVERLLACGHSVRVLCRPRGHPPPAGDVLEYLKVRQTSMILSTFSQKNYQELDYLLVSTLPQVLPGAEQHLTVVSGDVTDAVALQAAMAQCQQLVHLAGVVDVLPPRDEQQRQQMVSTALEGTRLVLGE